MAHVIVPEKCINCGSCSTECPTEAIREEAESYKINPTLCNDCGSCREVCPQECIKAPPVGKARKGRNPSSVVT